LHGVALAMALYNKAKHISSCLELAILFEISADKPGNVNLVVGFEGTRYEHFLASAVAATPSFELAAKRGVEVSRGEIRIGNVGLGRIIKHCVAAIDAWQRGGNTLLGTVILLSPIAVAAGMTPTKEEHIFKVPKLRENVKIVVESTTPEDAVNVYEAIKSANPSGLGTVPELDINDPVSINKIHEEKISLYRIFEIASKYDTICSEWVNNYPITFDVAYPYLMEQIRKTNDINVAIIHTFLKVLAEYPDTFIVRKVGIEKAREVSSMANGVLKRGGLETSSGRKSLSEFDHELRESSNLLNPGTTADIIAAALVLTVLSGYRP
jgi:triphosphoribosyl-dephospho-CoA synthase